MKASKPLNIETNRVAMLVSPACPDECRGSLSKGDRREKRISKLFVLVILR